MTQLPDEDDTPFSLPRDVPEITPVDYPALDSNVDLHEAYDEGLDDVIDINPYRNDDEPIRSSRRAMRVNINADTKLTTDHATIRRWVEKRLGQPARTKNTENGINGSGLRINFQNGEHDAETEIISWDSFFEKFENFRLAFVYKNRNRSGSESQFYKLIRRDRGG